MKKILLPVLALTLMFSTNNFAFAETFAKSYLALANFYDYNPDLIHDEPRVTEVISCNMVVKPKTQAHLSNLCNSAVANVVYYFNDSTNDMQKGPDYTNVVSDEIFYPASKLIENSYIGSTINYKVSCDFQTRKENGEKVHMEVPVDVYQSAAIISQKTMYLDMGEEYTLSQPTGDQSQPNWTGTKKAYPSLAGRYMNYIFRFGSVDSSVSGAVGLFKTKLKNVNVLEGVCYEVPEFTPEIAEMEPSVTAIDGVVYLNSNQGSSMNDQLVDICKRAKKLVMQYNLNANACNDRNEVVMEDGWVNIPESQAEQYLYFSESDNKLYYPEMANAWGRIIAVLEVEEQSTDYRPAKRVRVKSRISSYGGFKFNNLKEGDVVKIYNVNGKKVAELNAGTSDGFEWLGRKGTNNGGDWAESGTYIYQIKVKEKGKVISGTIAFVW
ncbi:MAG: hypothetical protein J6U02_01005 [Elusimicrobia bacterium]|nr:hypothetical protein [Elusimicrobiota bacterium]